jgi:phage host-nuclease inhibitor protein Gam
MTPNKHVEAAPAIATWEGADRVLGEIRRIRPMIADLEAEKNAKLADLQAKYDQRIQPLIENVNIRAKSLREFAEFHREDLGSMRSKELNHGRIGFRLGQPTIRPLAKKTWDWVLTLLRTAGRDDLIRTTESVNKEAFDSITTAEDLKKLGVQRVQEDRFFFEVKDDATVATKA